MNIRHATKQDCVAIARLFNQDPENVLGDPLITYEEEDIFDYLSHDVTRMVVCEIEGEIVGAFFAQFWKRYVHAHTLIVDEKHRGKGIGSALFNEIKDLAKKEGKDLIEAEVRDSNHLMQKILEKEGFVKGHVFQFFSKKI